MEVLMNSKVAVRN